MQYEPTPLTEKKVDGFMAYLTNEPFLVKAQGFTPVTLPFADNGLPLTVGDLHRAAGHHRQPTATCSRRSWSPRSWAGPTRSPTRPAAPRSPSSTYGKDLELDLAGQTEQAAAQNELIVSADTKANGLFTLTDELQAQIIGSARRRSASPSTADDLFDLSLLNEIYADNPEPDHQG